MSQTTLEEPGAAEAGKLVGTSRRLTSEPRWPLERPELDPAAQTLLIVAGRDPGAGDSVRAWQVEAGARSLPTTLLGEPTHDQVVGAAEGATSGARLLAAGDESLLSLVASAAMAAGWAPGEMRAHLTDPDGPRPVQCVHCRAITHTSAQVDETTDCTGCGVPLLLFPHWSRRIGAYLGFRVDAEEMP